MPPRPQPQNNNQNAELAALIAQQFAAQLPNVFAQFNQAAQNNNPNPPCTFKQFNSCNPAKYSGSEGATALLQWFESIENTFRHSQCTEARKVEFATSCFLKRALTWWNGIMRDRGANDALALSWDDLRTLMLREFCPRNEMRALEEEFHNLKQVSGENRAYIDRFEELCILCPYLLTTPERTIEKFIDGLPSCIKHIMTGSKPATIRDAYELSATLTDAMVKDKVLTRKGDGNTSSKGSTSSTEAANAKSQSSRNAKKRKEAQNFAIATPAPAGPAPSLPPAKRSYIGKAPLCNLCNYHHEARYPCPKCTKCGKLGHLATICRSPPAPNQVAPPPAPVAAPRFPMGTCFNCGDPNHFKSECPKLANVPPARGRVFNVNINEAQ